MKKREKEEALLKILNQNKSMILMICRAYATSREDIDDYFQEVATKLWQGLDTFKGYSTLKTWVYRIALNTCISFNIKESKKVATQQILENIDVIDDSSESKNIDALYKLISQLNYYDRALILLWLENLSYNEIAEIMGLTPNNVSVKLSRIKNKLKSLSNI